MEKRVIIFIIISIVVIIGWDYYLLLNRKAQPQIPQNPPVSTALVKENATKPNESSVASHDNSTSLTPILVKTPVYEGVLAKEQGFFKKLLLPKYFVDKVSRNFVDIMRDGYVEVYDVLNIDGKLVRVYYNNYRLSDNNRDIILTSDLPGLQVVKEIKIGDDYSGDINYKIIASDPQIKSLSIGIVIDQKFREDKGISEGHPTPHFFANKSYETPSERQLKKTFKLNNVTYGGVAEKYFALFFIDPKSTILAQSSLAGERVETSLFFPAVNIDGGREVSAVLKFFAGPKDPEVLKKVGYYLPAAVDYGFFHFIARPLLLILNLFYKFTHNYGVSIILLTILIKVLFFPLSQKSYKSMKALQKLQPKMEELRKKYGNDREALNREMMLLYKRYGVNPLSGCLPMLVQIPFFIALYQALMNAIELRHAPFVLWITDLSAKDPYYITPILMGITMLLQQMLTPSSGDPTQKKMMYILPVVFTFMFLNFPSGLVLYWLINNVFSILQQLYTMRQKEA